MHTNLPPVDTVWHPMANIPQNLKGYLQQHTGSNVKPEEMRPNFSPRYTKIQQQEICRHEPRRLHTKELVKWDRQ